MDMSIAQNADLVSLRQSLGIATMRKAMGQDAQTANTLIKDMMETTAKAMEYSVTPYKGTSIDIRA